MISVAKSIPVTWKKGVLPFSLDTTGRRDQANADTPVTNSVL